MWQIVQDNRAAYNAVKNGADLFDYQDLYEALYKDFVYGGEMPYGVAKARTGDPVEWIMNQAEVWTY